MIRLALLLLVFLFAGDLSGQSRVTAYDSLFNQLVALDEHTPANPPLVLPVGGGADTIGFRREGMVFRLESGRLYVLPRVNGRRVAMYFTGQGQFQFLPATVVERQQIDRRYGQPVLIRRFTSLLLMFADSTAEELLAGRPAPVPSRLTPDEAGTVRHGIGFLSHRKRRYFEPAYLTAFLNRETNELFAAVAEGASGGPFLLQVDPYEVEEVTLRTSRSGEGATDNNSSLVSQFNRPSEHRQAGPPPHDPKQTLSIHQYTMAITIGGNLRFAAEAGLQFEWLGPAQEWFHLVLHPELKLDSARWQGAGLATVVQSADNAMIWIRAPGQQLPWPRLNLYYRGEPLLAVGPWVLLQTPTLWYPHVPGLTNAMFDLRFETPADYQFVTVGALKDSGTAGRVLRSHWVSEQPLTHASFSLGKFDRHEITEPASPPITVFSTRGRPARDVREMLGRDLALSLRFFREAFGDPPAARFYASEIPGFHGIAYPGLLHLSQETYSSAPAFGDYIPRGRDETFRAHEIAHQWWGLGVQPRTYRDHWLGEGFATFASWWYAEVILADTATLRTMLRDTRDGLLLRRNAAPVAIGTRLVEEANPADYALVTYDKGAWVVWMLRYLMIDPAGRGEESFRGMLRDFYDSYRGGQASTAEFQAVVERHIGGSMDWFFQSWVYGTGIPSYEWASQTVPAGTQFEWQLKVRQRDVPEGFAMFVPVRLEFADGQEAFFRVLVRGAETDFKAAVPAEPVKVWFNAFDGVLAEVKQERWR